MIRIIPETRVFVCDRCKKENPRHVMGAKLNFDRAGLDYSGSPCGPGGFKADFCDECCMAFEKVFDQFRELANGSH